MAHGKSTLSKLIAGLLKPKSGRITVDNINTANKKEFYNLRKKIGMVFQNPENQIIFNNVYDDIAFALKNLELDNEEIKFYQIAIFPNPKVRKFEVREIDKSTRKRY